MWSVFRLLARLRGLRGTPFDPFGWQSERRSERQLATDYAKDIEALLAFLTPENHAALVEFAELPALIRGYGHVKQAGIANAQRRRTELAAALS